MLGGTRDWWVTELSDGDQNKHHIRSQCGESIFASTKDYSLGGGNEGFEISEENFRERTSLFRSWTYSSNMFVPF